MKRNLAVILLGLATVFAAGYYFYSSSIPGFWANNSYPGFWAINSSESSVTFTSVKNGDILEVHSISGIAGGADFTGEFSVTLDLRTVETNIDIRNERVNEFLFEIASYPVATISGRFEPGDFDGLPVGGTLVTRINGTLSLHGVEAPVAIDVEVVRTDWDKVMVSSFLPVKINAADFNLEGGLATLQDLVGLDSISPVSEISFRLVLEGDVVP